MPEVSILMGVYNGSRKYTAQAVNSILDQTFTDFELIICDDGSSDCFYRWLAAFCEKDPRIFLLRNEQNRGLAATLNRCLRHASGTYIARMDADDISKKERLERQVSFLRRHKEFVIAGCNAQMISGRSIWGIRRMEEMPRRESFLSTSAFIHPTIMIRREVLADLNGYCESHKVQRVEDYELFMRLYAAGYRGYNLQEELFQYRESRHDYGRRKYQYRIKECLVRWQGFGRLGIRKGNLRYVIKPLAAGLVPRKIMYKMRLKKYGQNADKRSEKSLEQDRYRMQL